MLSGNTPLAMMPDIVPDAQNTVEMSAAPNVYAGASLPGYAMEMPNTSSVTQQATRMRFHSGVSERNFCVSAALISRYLRFVMRLIATTSTYVAAAATSV